MSSDEIVCALLEDYKELRDIYSSLISHENDMNVVYSTGSPEGMIDFLETEDGKSVDILLLDIELDKPDSGILACRTIKEKHPDIRIIMLTCHEEEEKILDSFKAGATSYILKDRSFSDLLDTIRKVDKGEGGLFNRAATVLRNNIRDNDILRRNLISLNRSYSDLTVTEREILKHLYNGESQKDIAQSRNIELITVKTHVSSILKKFHSKSSRKIIKMIKDAELDDLIL